MSESLIQMQPIGKIYTPHLSLEKMPIQPKGAKDFQGKAILDEKWIPGLKDLEKFTHCYLLYWFHKINRVELQSAPYLDTEKRGVFAIRSPLRPVPIGISIVNILAISENELHFSGADMLNETPLLDIKPYIPKFDLIPEASNGWMQAAPQEIESHRSDERFA
jgi:tRNA (adenine37-N6)-methyltransferase